MVVSDTARRRDTALGVRCGDERKCTTEDASKSCPMTSKPGSQIHPGRSLEGACVPTRRCPASRWHERNAGACVEHGNLSYWGVAEATTGKVTRGPNHEGESPETVHRGGATRRSDEAWERGPSKGVASINVSEGQRREEEPQVQVG